MIGTNSFSMSLSIVISSSIFITSFITSLPPPAYSHHYLLPFHLPSSFLFHLLHLCGDLLLHLFSAIFSAISSSFLPLLNLCLIFHYFVLYLYLLYSISPHLHLPFLSIFARFLLHLHLLLSRLVFLHLTLSPLTFLYHITTLVSNVI